MNDILQIERLVGGEISQNENVIFDSPIYSSGNIDYDEISGIITLNNPGTYIFNWWIATQTAETINAIVLAISSSQGDLIIGNTPIRIGEVYGMGVITVTSPPVTVSLINLTEDTVYYSNETDVKANLLVTKMPEPNISYGGLYSDVSSVITMNIGVEEVVPLGEAMSSSNVTLGTNNITILLDGVYWIQFTVLLQSVSGIIPIQVGTRINGAFSDTSLYTALILTDSFENITIGTIVELSALDVLDLALFTNSEGTLLLGPGLNANLTVRKIDN